MIRRLLRSGRECPICGGHFDAFEPKKGRDQVRCPGCGSRERHRHLWLYLEGQTDFFTAPHRLLHIGPEPCFEARFAALPNLEYVGGDLNPHKRHPGGSSRQRIDVTDMDFPDGHFDCILCYHVLEHVPDDRAAMSELHRVLRPGGWAIIQVPVMGERTFEDSSVTDPTERLRRFGQKDHVRVYGEDFFDRLRAAGFQVRVDLFREQVRRRDRERLGLNYHFPPGDEAPEEGLWKIPFCTKPVLHEGPRRAGPPRWPGREAGARPTPRFLVIPADPRRSPSNAPGPPACSSGASFRCCPSDPSDPLLRSLRPRRYTPSHLALPGGVFLRPEPRR